MFDQEGYNHYLRQKISLENKLIEVGEFRVNPEIKSQMQFVEERLVARIKQSHIHAVQEMNMLRMVFIEATKDG